MIELYRASAGSGKTYTLAKKYLWYFLTISSENSKPRLRTEAELADSARHILAVTFTNKATNEMQMRIVDSLFVLANAEIETKTDKNGDKRIIKPVYMQDFIDELGVGIDNIRQVATKALSILLENYSDFSVSTIDSFFQQVLRTFAYESEVNESYQVELDSEYLSQVGVDATLEEIDNNEKDIATPFWINKIMSRIEGKGWNIFTRSQGSAPYADLVNSVKKMETEQYKLIRKEVEEYFDKKVDFLALYRDLCRKYETPVRQAHKEMCREFAALYENLPDELKEANTRADIGKIKLACNRIRKVASKWNISPLQKDFPTVDFSIVESKKFDKWVSDHPGEGEEVVNRFREACHAYDHWVAELTSPEFRHWNLYSANLPFYALFSIVSRKRNEYLEESNAIELGETSMIIRSVIGDSDAPFIYERMGNRLNHFLIDEFQDTSKMQWENLKPLVRESLSRGNGNLIIGDAKQSIYRFRNADPSLITSHVAREFGSLVSEKGNTPAENTNYRSDRNVVEFNNQFFSFLTKEIDGDIQPETNGRMSFTELYSNVVQTPNKKEDEGYIEVSFFEGSKKDANLEILPRIPILVKDMMARGYALKDIAVLIRKNSEADEVVASFNRYNAERGEDDPEIRFVSEQSLKLSYSPAVNIIVDVLTNLARGSRPQINTGEDAVKKGVGVWHDMVANFKFYQMSHPDEPLARVLEKYLDEGTDFNALTQLLGQLQSYAIPALVESIISAFVPEKLQISDAIYISAFQDLVLEYCDSHPTDIGSFLKWWERKKTVASVSSPEDTDAVQIVTVHKSKGLEYKCVIVPFANWEMGDQFPDNNKVEWLWVKPEVVSHEELPLPPYMPIETARTMLGTAHEPLLLNYFDMSKMDALNAAYVAFTRAEKELYIFCTVKKPGKTKTEPSTVLGRYLREFLGEDGDKVSRGVKPQCVGKPEQPKQKVEISSDVVLLREYKSIKSPEFLKYANASMPEVMQAAEMEEDDLDPRSEGNLKHAVLELVREASDLPKAIRHLMIKGVIPETAASQIEESLAKAISRPEVARWFDGEAEVINERPVLSQGEISRRPDRLMVYPDGHVEVVDYKFGKIDKSGKYRKQISRYVNLLKQTGDYKEVKGYLWYINENQIQEFT